ncbi:DUF6894 family protein [Methylobacterium terrae]|uniref:DUF6894 family protein n=1 Tax=Methylobacterium terrae TaxID=2202827 RepID=UPI001ABFE8D6|nr:hypothetical protein [Methylobacterium terrae]
MPRFYFHVFDSAAVLDPEGAELPNWQDAQSHAIRYMGEILQSNAKLIDWHDDFHMDVTDKTGLLLFRLDFSIVRSVALNYTSGLISSDASPMSAVASRHGEPSDK